MAHDGTPLFTRAADAHRRTLACAIRDAVALLEADNAPRALARLKAISGTVAAGPDTDPRRVMFTECVEAGAVLRQVADWLDALAQQVDLNARTSSDDHRHDLLVVAAGRLHDMAGDGWEALDERATDDALALEAAR